MKYALAIETKCEDPTYFVLSTFTNTRFSRSRNITYALQAAIPGRTPPLPLDIDSFTILAYFDNPLSLMDTHPELFI